ncbi:MAG: RNA methyltransferase [Zoogloeaceae bacterium]|nr:RNA methyltransferase [Zoogloeaceae bacterium]
MPQTPPLRCIRSRDNADFKYWKKLAHHRRTRRQERRIMLEGVHLAEEWLAAHGRPEVALLSPQGHANADIMAWLNTAECAAVMLADALFRELSGTETPAGLIVIATLPTLATPPATDRDTLALDGVQDPGNLGCLLRNAAAAGIAQVVLSADCAEAWSPKALRAGQGAQFRLRLYEDVDLPAFLRMFQGDTLATALEDAASLYSARWRHPLAWVMGSEGQGLRPETLAACRQRVRIPMPGATESLNVVAAAAVCLFEMTRRDLAAAPPV